MRESRIVSKKFDAQDSHRLAVAQELGAYSAIKDAFGLTPTGIIEMINLKRIKKKYLLHLIFISNQ